MDDRASDLISGVCLGLFLVMTMMALNLIEVALSAGPFLVILAAQVVAIVLYVVFICFRFMGRDYEAAVTSAAFIGFNMGSTATAMANMQAITNKYGPAPQSLSDRAAIRRILHRHHECVPADRCAGTSIYWRMNVRALINALVVLAVAGCGAGPDETALKKDVAERVTQALPAGTVTIATFERRGSQSDTKAPSGETRRIIYFDTELKLDRDFDFGAWDSPGVAGIVSALGAGPKGIVGITSGGNKAGDRVLAHGTVLYKREGDKWAPTVSAGFAPTHAPAYATAAPQGGAIGLVDQMRTTVQNVPKDISPATRALIEQELAAANAAIRAAVARATQGYAIAAGAEHGQYFRFAQALSDPGACASCP